MTTQHTPGPWQVKPSNNEITNADHGRLPFAIVAGYTLIGATYENGKDARLIAAAPDLLKAAKTIMENLDGMAGEVTAGYHESIIAPLRDAIAKATEVP
jgi:hypothetical protein